MKKAIFALFSSLFFVFLACSHDKSQTDVVIEEGKSEILHTQHIDTLSEIVSRVQNQSRLFTTESQIHKIVLFSDEAHVGGKLLDIKIPGERKVAIPIDVTVKGYVDFSEFASSNVIMKDSVCIITLPDPKLLITSSKINHSETRQYVGVTRSNFSDAEISRLAAQGEDTIASHLASYGLIDRSRESCARTLVPILKGLGYKEHNIIVRFNRNYSNEDLRHLSSFQK